MTSWTSIRSPPHCAFESPIAICWKWTWTAVELPSMTQRQRKLAPAANGKLGDVRTCRLSVASINPADPQGAINSQFNYKPLNDWMFNLLHFLLSWYEMVATKLARLPEVPVDCRIHMTLPEAMSAGGGTEPQYRPIKLALSPEPSLA